MKILLTWLFLFFSVFVFSQTTLTFSQLASSPDLINQDRGAEQWIGRIWDNGVGGGIKVPAGNTKGLNAYYRFLWGSDIEKTTQGVYDWTKFDQQINAAIDNGQRFSFGLMPMCTVCGQSFSGYPSYLHTLMQAETTNSKDWTNADGNWVPNWNSPNYLARYQALLNAAAAHIASGTHAGKNYRDVIFYVDIRGYGDFGEWHTYPWTGTEPTGRAATSATLKSLIDMNLAAFPNYPNVVLVGAYDPGNASVTPNDVSYYALTQTNAWGQIGWRRDNWGDPGTTILLDNNPGSYNPGDSVHHFKYIIMDKYKYAPVVGEPNNSTNTFSCGSMYCDLDNEVKLYHTNSFGNGNFPNTFDVPTQNNVINSSRDCGYRLTLTGGSMTSTLSPGSSFNVTVNWQNTGVAPVYENWNVTYELRTNGGAVVWSGTSGMLLKGFLPGSPVPQSDNFTLSNIGPGSYFLYMKIKDPLNYATPFFLAITTRTVDGAYLIRNVNVVAGGPSFNINAGPDQTLSTGTTNTTLTGVTPADTVNLLVIQGESNAAGEANNADATSGEKASRSKAQILNHPTGGFVNLDIGTLHNNEQNTFAPDPPNMHGFELALANYADSSKYATGNIWLVKMGFAGGVICQWLPGGCVKVGDSPPPFDAWGLGMPWLDSAVSKLNQAGKKFRIIFITSIGLNDRYNQGTTPATFMSKFATFIQNVKNRYGRQNIQFLCTDFNNPPAQTYSWTTNFTQMAQTIPGFHSIPVTGATYIDGDTHFDYAGFKKIVKNMIDTMLFSPLLQTGVGGPYTQTWSKQSGPNNPTITTPNAKTTTITGMVNGTYVFRFTVTDSLGTIKFDDVTVNITGGGSAVGPVAHIVPTSQTITLPTNSVSLSGSTSTDDNGTITGYNWSMLSGANVPTFVAGGANVTISNLIQGNYVFQLQITDNNSNQSATTATVTVNPAIVSGFTIFTTQTPVGGVNAATGNDGPQSGVVGIETGVKFRSNVAGYINGVRFYKTVGNTGTHIGELYNSAGVRLAQATYTNETASGWQTVMFSNRVPIAANTTYIAAYFSATGNYISTNGFFTAPIVNTPLTGLASGTDGPNGLYRYTSSPGAPNASYLSGNYWIDAVFSTTPPPPVPLHIGHSIYWQKKTP